MFWRGAALGNRSAFEFAPDTTAGGERGSRHASGRGGLGAALNGALQTSANPQANAGLVFVQSLGTNQPGTRPSGVRTSSGEGTPISTPAGWYRMSSDVPSDCTNASSVACGLADVCSAPLSAAATAPAARAAAAFSSSSCVGAKIWSETVPSSSAAPNIRPSGSNRRVRSERLSHIWTIIAPATPDFPFQIPPTAYLISKGNSMMQNSAKSHQGPDRRRPSGGPVGLPVVVRIRQHREDRRGHRC